MKSYPFFTCSALTVAGSSLFGGLACLDTGDGKIDTDSLEVHECSYTGEELTVAWKLQHSLFLKSQWSISVSTMTGPDDSQPHAVVEAGMVRRHLRISFAAGEILKLPELLIYDAGTAGWPGSASDLDFNA